MHLTGGGVMKSVSRVSEALAANRGPIFGDITLIFSSPQVEQWVTNPVLQALVRQYVYYNG